MFERLAKGCVLFGVGLSLSACHLDVNSSDPLDSGSDYSCTRRVVQLDTSAYDNGCPKISDFGQLISWTDSAGPRGTVRFALRPLWDGHYPKIDRLTYHAYADGTTTDRDLHCTVHDQGGSSGGRSYECTLPHESSDLANAEFYLSTVQVSSQTCYSASSFRAQFEDSRCSYRWADPTDVAADGMTMPVVQPQS